MVGMSEFDEQWRRTRRLAGALNGPILMLGGLLMIAVGIEKGEPLAGFVLGTICAAGGFLLFWWTRRV